jgi:RNA polymerase sigma factor (sigma-70 family)
VAGCGKFVGVKESPVVTLSLEEERRLLQSIKTGDLHARGRIALSQGGIIRKLALRYGRFGLPLDDLIQEGYLAVFHAVELFQPRGTTRLSTYATWWIRHYMRRAIASQRGPISFPINMLKADGGKFVAERIDDCGGDSGATQTHILGCVCGIMRRHDVQVEQLVDVSQPTPLEHITSSSMRNAIRMGVEKLNAAEAQVIRLRYGLDGSVPMTLEGIGRSRGISRESVRLMERSALRKLRGLFRIQG